MFFADRIFRAASNGDTVQIPCQIWQAWHFLRCDKIDERLADFEIPGFKVHQKLDV